LLFTRSRSLRFRSFFFFCLSFFLKIQDGGGRHLENHKKSRYHSNGLIDLREIWHDYAKMGLLAVQTVKNLNFQNPRWRTAAGMKTVKSTYLRNRLTDFGEIWHSGAEPSPRPIDC